MIEIDCRKCVNADLEADCCKLYGTVTAFTRPSWKKEWRWLVSGWAINSAASRLSPVVVSRRSMTSLFETP